MTPEDAREVRARAEAGDPEALALAAMLAAIGAWEPQSWPLAADRLVRAAELGHAAARDQIAVLAGSRDGALRPLATRIDWAAWLGPAPRQRLRDDPRMAVSPGFLTPAACDWLIGRAAGRAAPARVFDPEGGAARTEAGRTNSAFEFGLEEMDVVTAVVRARIAATVNVPVGALEPTQALHYAPGQQFERHFDFLDTEVHAYAQEAARHGQRIATFLIYLNAGFQGGETDFPELGVRHKGGAGDGFVFSNVTASGAPDRRTLHAGLPPTSGEKWLLSQWIRDRARA